MSRRRSCAASTGPRPAGFRPGSYLGESRRDARRHTSWVQDGLGRHPGVGPGDELATRLAADRLAESPACRGGEEVDLLGVGPGDGLLEQAHRPGALLPLAGDARECKQRGRVEPLAWVAQQFPRDRLGGRPKWARIRGSGRRRHGAAALALPDVALHVLDPRQERRSDRRPGRLRSPPGGRSVGLVQVNVSIAVVVRQVLHVETLLAPLRNPLRGERPGIGRIVGG